MKAAIGLGFVLCLISPPVGRSPAWCAAQPQVADWFQDAPFSRWSSAAGTWKVTECLEMYDLARRDIYFSPEEPSHLAWVSLWKENDGCIKTSFAQVTGNPGLEPSYAPWYGSGRTKEDWQDFAKRHRMRVGPWEEANRTTKAEFPTLVTHDNGKTWRNLGTNHRPRGGNLRVVQLKDGGYVVRGISLIRCRDGRLVSTGVFEGDKVHGANNPQPGDLVTVSESLDSGKTWSKTQHLRPPDATILKPDQVYEENAMVELADGRILVVIRTDPGSPCQTYLTRSGPGQYTATPPVWTPMGNTGMPELIRCSDGTIWYWGLEGHWFTLDDGKTWRRAPVRFTSYYGKMVEAAPGLVLSVTQNQIQDCPYPWSHDASIQMVKFRYRRSGIVAHTDPGVPLAMLRRSKEQFADVHLRADMRVGGASGLAFRVSPDGKSYYAAAVVMPGTQVYKRWFPPEMQAAALSANYTPEDTRTIAAGYPMVAIARVDGSKLNVLRGMRLSGVKRGAWIQIQVRAKGDLIRAAVNSEMGYCEVGALEISTNRDTGPTYVGVRDSAHRAGSVGLLTDMSTGAFKDFSAWPSAQMIRDTWVLTSADLQGEPAEATNHQAASSLWTHAYEAEVIPPVADPAWEDYYVGENIGTVEDGILTIRSTLEQQEHYCIQRGSSWTASADGTTTVECRVKVVKSVAPDKPAALLSFSNGAYMVILYFFADRVALGPVWRMDTTDRFHTYRVVLTGNEVKLFVDDDPKPVITAAASPSKANNIYFGDASNYYVGGESQWDYVRWK